MSAPSLVLARSRPRVWLAGAALALFAGASAADPDATAQREIEHLLDYVAASKCTFVRNGERFPADKAREHLAMKYQWTRSRMTTAEEFIKYLATESSMSHQPYTIVCANGKERPTGAWLAEELKHFRAASIANK